jgi:hypothetical protein
MHMRLSLRTVSTATLAAGLSLGTVLAQDPNVPGSGGWASEPTREATVADPGQVAATLAERWEATAEARGYRVDAWRTQLDAAVQRLSADRLRQAQRAVTYAEMVEAVTGKNPERLTWGQDSALQEVTTQALGQNSDDLSFTAITPCRLMDTRFGTGVFAGPRAAGSTTSISTSIVASIAAQGGSATGCPELSADAGALAYTLTVVDYSGNAFVTVFPFTAVRPNASTINMGPGTSPSPVANSSVVLQCYLCGDEVSIYVEGASTNVIIDAVGYYNPTPSTTSTANRTTTLGPTTTCQNYTLVSLTNPSTRARAVACSAVVTGALNHVANIHDEVVVNVATSAATCGTYNTSGVGFLDILNTAPAGCCWHQSTQAQSTFSLAAGTAQIYYLNVVQLLGSGDDFLSTGQLRCTLLN